LLLAAGFDSIEPFGPESFDPESFDPELTTEGLTTEGLTADGLVAGLLPADPETGSQWPVASDQRPVKNATGLKYTTRHL
jgi:hypothetical protein